MIEQGLIAKVRVRESLVFCLDIPSKPFSIDCYGGCHLEACQKANHI